MEFGALWKNREGDDFNGRLELDASVILFPGVKYNLWLNKVDKKGNEKAPDYRLSLTISK